MSEKPLLMRGLVFERENADRRGRSSRAKKSAVRFQLAFLQEESVQTRPMCATNLATTPTATSVATLPRETRRALRRYILRHTAAGFNGWRVCIYALGIQEYFGRSVYGSVHAAYRSALGHVHRTFPNGPPGPRTHAGHVSKQPGVPVGVSLVIDRRRARPHINWVACWISAQGGQTKKRFSVHAHGWPGAFWLACEERRRRAGALSTVPVCPDMASCLPAEILAGPVARQSSA